MKKLVLILPLLLTGCGTFDEGIGVNETVVTTDKLTVVTPPPSMYSCSIVTNYPKADTLKDSEVAKLIVEMNRKNQSCKNHLDAIKRYLDQAKTTVEAQ